MDPISIITGLFVGGLFFKSQQDLHKEEQESIKATKLKANKAPSNNNNSNNT